MSDVGRRVFPMDTALRVVAGKSGVGVLDLLGFAIQRGVEEDCRNVVGPMVKGWLFSQNPEFFKGTYDPKTPYDSWVTEQKKRLGNNVSMVPMSQEDAAGVYEVLDLMAALKQTAEEKTAAAEDAEAAAEEARAQMKILEPFKAKAEKLEQQVAQLDEKSQGLAAEVAELNAKLGEFAGKLAIDEADLSKTVKEIVSSAVKGAVGALAATGAAGTAAPVAGAAAPAVAASGGTPDPASEFGFGDSFGMTDGFGAAPAADAAPAAPAEGEVPSDFGFGTSGANNDGFGF